MQFKRDVTRNRLIHICSKHITNEVETILCERMELTHRKAKATARLLERQSIIVEPKRIEHVCRDPFDDYILAAALAGRAAYIVTEDKDLLVLENYRGIKILTLTEFRKTGAK